MRFVVIGGGAAGVAAAQRLRALAPAAPITIVEEEPFPYYIRPGLIDLLAGEKSLAAITPYPPSWFSARGMDYLLGEKACGLDLCRQEVVLASGKRISYDRVLLATGAEPVRLRIPGAERPGVFTLRAATDVERIRAWMEGKRRAVILGSGWLGLEAAWALGKSLEVVVVERGPWPMARWLDAEAGAVLLRHLSRLGLPVLCGSEAVEIRGDPEVKNVLLRNGTELQAELVLVAVGVTPRAGLARESGLSTNKGVVVDDWLCTSALGVFAAGDVAEWRGLCGGAVAVAREQGTIAAQNMVEPGSARYQSAGTVQRLKVAGVDLLFLRRTPSTSGPPLAERMCRDWQYAKIVLGEGRELLEAVLVGDQELADEVERLFHERVPVPEHLLFAH